MRWNWLFLLFGAAVTAYFLTHIEPFPAFHYAIAAVLIVYSLVSLRRASVLFLITMIIVDDFSKAYDVEILESAPVQSLYSLSVAGLTVSSMLIFYFAGANLLALLVQKKTAGDRAVGMVALSPEMKMILTIGAISAFVGLINLTHAPRIFISDLGYFINILLGYTIVRANAGSPERFTSFFGLVILALMAKVFAVIMDAALFSRGQGLMTIMPGSDSYLMSALVLSAIVTLGQTRGVALAKRLGPIAVIVLTLGYFVLTAARGRMISGILSLFIFLYAFKLKHALAYVVLAVISLVALLQFMPQEYLGYLSWKLGSFAASTEGGESALVRVVSLQNILAQQWDTIYQIFTGTGMGGYFTSQYYPFPIILTDGAFPDEWVLADRFYKPHGTLMFLLLKVGLVGLLAILGTVAWQNFKLLNALRCDSHSALRVRRVVLVSASLIFPLMLVNFSPKLQLLTGALLGFVYFGRQWINGSSRTLPR